MVVRWEDSSDRKLHSSEQDMRFASRPGTLSSETARLEADGEGTTAGADNLGGEMATRMVRHVAAIVRRRHTGARRHRLWTEDRARRLRCWPGNLDDGWTEDMASRLCCCLCGLGNDTVPVLYENDALCVTLFRVNERIADRLLDRPHQVA